jgi:hypothetical protein
MHAVASDAVVLSIRILVITVPVLFAFSVTELHGAEYIGIRQVAVRLAVLADAVYAPFVCADVHSPMAVGIAVVVIIHEHRPFAVVFKESLVAAAEAAFLLSRPAADFFKLRCSA